MTSREHMFLGIGLGLGALVMAIILNFAAQSAVQENPNISLNEYYFGK